MELPRLEALSNERHVWVDAEQGGAHLAQRAKEALRQPARLRVAVDAEWHEPEPISLLQLAVSLDHEDPEVFLVDMVRPPAEEVLAWCGCLLKGEHEVLVYSPKEDQKRLQEVGVISGECQWLDVQRLDWGLGNQPGLQAVVAWALGRWMDKSLQTSDWNQRPLSGAQKAYAALDASVLLRLHGCERTGPLPQKRLAKPKVEEATGKDRWSLYRTNPARQRPRHRSDDAREANADLCFLLPAALTRLMRKLRGLGLDSLIMKEGSRQGELVEQAEREDRIILYYNTKNLLPARVSHRTYMLTSTSPDEQLREVIEAFEVHVDSDVLCGRCVHCNAWDWRLVGREEVKDNPKVAQKTLESFDEFWLCGGCGKVYWEGKMFVKALDHFRSFMPEAERRQDELVAQRTKELEGLGWSSSRIRASLVREGLLSAERALEDEAAVNEGYGRVSACGRQASRPWLSVLPALCLLTGHVLSPATRTRRASARFQGLPRVFEPVWPVMVSRRG